MQDRPIGLKMETEFEKSASFVTYHVRSGLGQVSIDVTVWLGEEVVGQRER